MAKAKPAPKDEEPKVCENCGSIMLQDDEGKWYYPSCDGEIDWGMDEKDDE